MKIPKKIGLVDSLSSEETWFKFDDWEGNSPSQVAVHLAHKINDVIDFLYEHPALENEIAPKLKVEGDKVIHDHHWKKLGQVGIQHFFVCTDCGESKVSI